MKRLAALLIILLLNACNFYGEQVIKGEQVVKPNNPVVKLNMTVTQDVKMKN